MALTQAQYNQQMATLQGQLAMSNNPGSAYLVDNADTLNARIQALSLQNPSAPPTQAQYNAAYQSIQNDLRQQVGGIAAGGVASFDMMNQVPMNSPLNDILNSINQYNPAVVALKNDPTQLAALKANGYTLNSSPSNSIRDNLGLGAFGQGGSPFSSATSAGIQLTSNGKTVGVNSDFIPFLAATSQQISALTPDQKTQLSNYIGQQGIANISLAGTNITGNIPQPNTASFAKGLSNSLQSVAVPALTAAAGFLTAPIGGIGAPITNAILTGNSPLAVSQEAQANQNPGLNMLAAVGGTTAGIGSASAAASQSTINNAVQNGLISPADATSLQTAISQGTLTPSQVTSIINESGIPNAATTQATSSLSSLANPATTPLPSAYDPAAANSLSSLVSPLPASATTTGLPSATDTAINAGLTGNTSQAALTNAGVDTGLGNALSSTGGNLLTGAPSVTNLGAATGTMPIINPITGGAVASGATDLGLPAAAAGTAASGATTPSSTTPAASSSTSGYMNPDGSINWNNVLGTAAALTPSVLSYLGSQNIANQQNDLAQQYLNMGAPYRQKLSDLMSNPSSYLSSPEVTIPVQQGTDTLSRSLSMGGNPVGSGNALQQLQTYSTNQLYNNLQSKENQLAGFGGLSSYNAAAPSAASNAINAQAPAYGDIGYGLSTLLSQLQKNNVFGT